MSFTRASYSRQSTHDERLSALESRHVVVKRQPLSVRRAFGTAVSVIIGLTLCYAGLHYIPTFLRSSHVIDTDVLASKKSILDIDRNRMQRFGAAVESYLLQRTYLRAGQGITVHYSLPEGATLDLRVKQCRRIYIGEVFHCTPISEQTVRIENNTKGKRTLKFAEPGFYHFDETVGLQNPDQPFKLIWVRS